MNWSTGSVKRMPRSDFAAFILTHGRAGNVKTERALRRHGYTGDVVYLIDDEDEDGDEYRRRYETVRTFCKQEYIDRVDTMCPSSDIRRGVILYARNAAIDIGREMGYGHIVELDDDYTRFEHRYVAGKTAKTVPIDDLDTVFRAMCEFVDRTGCSTLAMGQGGDFIGGAKGPSAILSTGDVFRRKAMNSFVLRTDTDFRFYGAVNEDAVTYVLRGGTGDVILTNFLVNLCQTQTQKSRGGMTEEYMDDGTYCKSMFAVVARPDCVTVTMMGNKNKRLHRHIEWDSAVPKIIRG